MKFTIGENMTHELHIVTVYIQFVCKHTRYLPYDRCNTRETFAGGYSTEHHGVQMNGIVIMHKGQKIANIRF